MGNDDTQVLRKALRDTRRFFGWNIRSIIVAAAFPVGFLLFWRLRGIDAAMTELYVLAAFTLAPIGAFALLLFLWNLFLAPSRLTAEQIRGLRGDIAKTFGRAKRELGIFDFEPPDYGAWRKVEAATIFEIARLCAGEEPLAMPVTGRENPFERLIIEGVEKAKIRRADKKQDQGVQKSYYPKLDKLAVVIISDVEKHFADLGVVTDFFGKRRI